MYKGWRVTVQLYRAATLVYKHIAYEKTRGSAYMTYTYWGMMWQVLGVQGQRKQRWMRQLAELTQPTLHSLWATDLKYKIIKVNSQWTVCIRYWRRSRKRSRVVDSFIKLRSKYEWLKWIGNLRLVIFSHSRNWSVFLKHNGNFYIIFTNLTMINENSSSTVNLG